MERVNKLIEAGASIPGAIKEALGMSVTDFAERHGLDRATVSGHINGSARCTPETARALCAELGGTEAQWLELLWRAARPQPSSQSPVA